MGISREKKSIENVTIWNEKWRLKFIRKIIFENYFLQKQVISTQCNDFSHVWLFNPHFFFLNYILTPKEEINRGNSINIFFMILLTKRQIKNVL